MRSTHLLHPHSLQVQLGQYWGVHNTTCGSFSTVIHKALQGERIRTFGAVVLTLKAIGSPFGFDIVSERLTRTVSGPNNPISFLLEGTTLATNTKPTVEAQLIVRREVYRHGGGWDKRG